MRPTYVPGAAGIAPADLGLQQVDLGGDSALPILTAVTPRHLAASRTSTPTLYWHIDRPSDAPAEIVVTLRDETFPLVELWIDPPLEAGLHAVALADLALQLEPDVFYGWYVSLVPDPDDRERDAIAGGALQHVPLVGSDRQRVEDAPPGYLGHRLAETGYWLDAFDTFTRWRAASPDDPLLRDHQAALLRQIGLDAVGTAVAR